MSMYTRNPFLSLLCLFALLGLPPLTQAATAPAKTAPRGAVALSYSAGTNACTAHENWFYGSAVTSAVREKLGKVPTDAKSATESLVASYAIKQLAGTPELSALADYRLARAFYELNLWHLAEQGFVGLLATYPPGTGGTQAIKIAALACLNRIHRKLPSMGIASEAAASLGKIDVNRLSDERKQAVREAMVSSATRKLFVNGAKAALAGELELLKGSGAYETFVQLAQAQALGDEIAVITRSETLFKYPSLPEALRAQSDGAHLNLGYSYYHAGKYGPAADEFKRVGLNSNFYSRALLGSAWSQMMTKQYSAAAGASYNLLIGSLRETFAPDASVIIAMALFENCHHRESRDALALFRKRYDASYRWIYEWNQQRKKSPAPLYPVVAEYLRSGKGLPAALASEWIRSPVFIAEQQEMNLLFDESQAARKLMTDASELKNQVKLKGVLARFIERVPAAQQATMARIDAELVSRSLAMIPPLVEAYETAQLVEVEIYNQVGDELTRRNLAAQKSGAAPTRATQGYSTAGHMPVLEWGHVNGESQGEGGETWEDELGAVRTEISDGCTRKK